VTGLAVKVLCTPLSCLFQSRPAPQSHSPPFHSTFTTFSQPSSTTHAEQMELQDHQHQARSDKMPPQPHSPQNRTREVTMTDQPTTEASLTQTNLTTVHQTIMHHSQITTTSTASGLQLPRPRANFPLPRECSYCRSACFVRDCANFVPVSTATCLTVSESEPSARAFPTESTNTTQTSSESIVRSTMRRKSTFTKTMYLSLLPIKSRTRSTIQCQLGSL
jgi:hypothetical protein